MQDLDKQFCEKQKILHFDISQLNIKSWEKYLPQNCEVNIKSWEKYLPQNCEVTKLEQTCIFIVFPFPNVIVTLNGTVKVNIMRVIKPRTMYNNNNCSIYAGKVIFLTSEIINAFS